MLSLQAVFGMGVLVRWASEAARSIVQTILSEVPAGICPFHEVMKGVRVPPS